MVDNVAAPSPADGDIASEMDGEQLSKSYYTAYKRYSELLGEGADIPSQEKLDELFALLKSIAWRARELHLFSPNEELDDINTTDLKFLLVPFLMAETVAATRDMERRLDELRKALVFWQAFCADCERLQVADAEDVKALNRDPQDKPTQAQKREEKIARYKRCKELDEQVSRLFERKKELKGDEWSWGASGGFDEESERDLIIALLKRSVSRCVEQIALTQEELPMLEIMAARGGPDAPPPKREKPPLDSKPWCIRIQDKAELQKLYLEQVFQPDIPMPTISIAEAAEAEIQEMQEREQREKDFNFRQQYAEHTRWYGGDRYGSQEQYEDEQKDYKDRSWDDWKDENPRGSGNKMANVA
mmetsp:Transcript_43694/g.103135  ORF Transcript_43694/g.103135 Transcript_43694/m.103135 type:complete len:360 (-) Transcript_43694:147-1226(-)